MTGRRGALAAVLALACGGESSESFPAPEHPTPYPATEVIEEVVIDWSTLRREARESDNWALTWADDGHQYAAWGDGFGFAGERPKISLGFSRIEGGPRTFTAEDVFRGDEFRSGGEFDAKSYGILALDGTLYAWLYPGSLERAWLRSRLYRSDDRGRSWSFTGLEIPGDTGLGMPWFLQAGRGYSGRPDEHVYVYFIEIEDPSRWGAQTPGLVSLARVPLATVEDFEAYRFFAGDSAGASLWAADPGRREPVLRDPNGLMFGSAIHAPALDRFLLLHAHSGWDEGNLAMFEGPTPWGPWRTVMYEEGWGADHIAPTTFYWNLAPAWLRPDGGFVLVFTGVGENDAWQSVEGRFVVRGGSGARAP